MDRIALIGIEGLNNLSEREDLESFSAFDKLVNQAAKGVLENEIPLNWDQAWELALSGSYKAIEAGKNLVKDLPKRGISTLFLSKEHQSEAPAEQILADNVTTVLQGIPQKPVQLMDLLVVELKGYSDYLAKGGDLDQYWKELDAALGKLLESFAENTVIFTVAPVDTTSSSTGIGFTKWLVDQNYVNLDNDADSLVKYDPEQGLLTYSEQRLEEREAFLDALRSLKVYARRGGDLRVVEVKMLPERMIRSDQDGENVYVSPKRATIYLDAEVPVADGENLKVDGSKTFFSNNGSIFVSGYKIDLEKELADISVLSIVPTIRDCFNLEADWEMVKNSFKYQFSLRVVEEQAAAASGDESAVRSRLEALGY